MGGSAVRQARGYVTGARDQLESELGSDLAELRKPLQDLAKLRGLDRGTITRDLLDATGGYDPREDLRDLTSANVTSAAPAAAGGLTEVGHTGLAAGERPPFDPDAT